MPGRPFHCIMDEVMPGRMQKTAPPKPGGFARDQAINYKYDGRYYYYLMHCILSATRGRRAAMSDAGEAPTRRWMPRPRRNGSGAGRG